MAEIFHVELSGGNSLYADLALPATDYELLDVLDRLRMTPDQSPELEITQNKGFNYLHAYLNDGNLYELNGLARKLDEMDATQKTAFEGLFQIALSHKEGPMCFADLMTYANSVDGCQVVHEATDDASLGKFYASYGFVPEVEDLPDNLFELLNFEKIGRDARKAERGAFTRTGYVLQSDELKHVSADFSARPTVPPYSLRLLVARYPFESDAEPTVTATLDLPTSQEELNRALNHIGAASWEEVIFTGVDSAIPGFPDEMYGESYEELNDYAQTIKDIQERSNLPKLKAVLSAKGCTSISEALQVAEHLNDYIYEQAKHCPEDVAREEIHCSLTEDDAEMLIKHVDLYGYGKDVMEQYNYELTEYGLISRRDGQPIQAQENNSLQMSM